MATDLVIKGRAFHHCVEVDWSKTAVQDGFVSYSFENSELIGLEAITIRANKQVRSSDEMATSFSLPVVAVYIRSGVSRSIFKVARRDYDNYRRLVDNLNEAGCWRLVAVST